MLGIAWVVSELVSQSGCVHCPQTRRQLKLLYTHIIRISSPLPAMKGGASSPVGVKASSLAAESRKRQGLLSLSQ